jgi:hypothetical protein
LKSQLPDTIGTDRGPSVDGASPALLSELLLALELEMRGQGVPVERYLRAGLSARDVEAGFRQCGLRAPDEAIEWFGWHDGPARGLGGDNVMPMFMGWSLAESIQAYLDPNGQPHGSEDWQWDPLWIQIMGDANGLALDCSPNQAIGPRVRGLTWDRKYGTQPDQTLRQVVSLCTPVSWWIDALRHGWYRWNARGNGWEDVDHSKQPRIRALHALS